jgi:uncharacterized protein YidB (DUF937 family)
MKTRWMIAGSLLTLVAIAVVVVFGGVALAQQGADEATPEPSAVEDASAPLGFAHHDFHFGWMEHFDSLARLAEIMGISTGELREALADGQTLAEVAAANGMRREELIEALLAEAEELLALATEGGFLDEEQIEFIRDWMTDGVGLLVNHPLPFSEEWWELGFHNWHALLDAEDFDLPERLAELLGVTLEELVEAVLDGASLAEIAEANGVDPHTVIDFLIAEAEAELDEAVSAEYLTEEQAQVLRGWIEDGVELVVNNRLVFPNGFDLVKRLGTKFDAHFGKIDWEKWAGFDWGEFIGQDPLSVAAEVVGVSHSELLEAIVEGQSLAEIAEVHGVDVQEVVDAQTEAVTDLLDDLAAEGLIPDNVSDLIEGHLGQGMRMLADHGFPFAEHWNMMGDDWTPWLKHWFNCRPCDSTEGGE